MTDMLKPVIIATEEPLPRCPRCRADELRVEVRPTAQLSDGPTLALSIVGEAWMVCGGCGLEAQGTRT